MYKSIFTFALIFNLGISSVIAQETYKPQADKEVEVITTNDEVENFDTIKIKKVKKKKPVAVQAKTTSTTKVTAKTVTKTDTVAVEKPITATASTQATTQPKTQPSNKPTNQKDETWWGYVKKQYRKVKWYSKNLWIKYTK